MSETHPGPHVLNSDEWQVSIQWEYTHDGHSLEFDVREIAGFKPGEPNTPLFGDPFDGEADHPLSEDRSNGDLVMRGEIRWDNCSHWYVGAEGFAKDVGYWHFCSAQEARKVGEIMAFLYERAEEMEAWLGREDAAILEREPQANA